MRLKLASLFTGALSLVATSGSATVFLNEHFDSYGNQAAFQGVWAVPSGSASLTLTNDQSVTPSQSIEGLTTATRNLLTLSEIGFLNGSSDTVIFRFNFYDSNGSAAAY